MDDHGDTATITIPMRVIELVNITVIDYNRGGFQNGYEERVLVEADSENPIRGAELLLRASIVSIIECTDEKDIGLAARLFDEAVNIAKSKQRLGYPLNVGKEPIRELEGRFNELRDYVLVAKELEY